ncbi:RAB6-interacting golgin isoform X3 [Macrotis lagotis]|uniref:RAB6-interacting golgin isoform X3 n=1 Tax=Macrotis lagotis TaxID=92651 RepID=UPI003D680DDA
MAHQYLQSSCFLHQNRNLTLNSITHHPHSLSPLAIMKSIRALEINRKKQDLRIPIIIPIKKMRVLLQNQTVNWKKRKWNCYRQEKSHWEVLQEEQRLMEEKNKRKKAFLAKAIAERSKRTQAETMKLQRIQKELQALDDMVSADIGILRNRIDQASLDYSYARKRFDKAEAEYVAAKLDLQRKTEIKEHLTEHLCTIIQQNELRKARKLEALMQQLEVEADEESLELDIEVERLLQQQEEEGKRQAAHPEEALRPSGNGVTLETATEAVGVPQVEGQDMKSGTRACPDPGRPEQEGKSVTDTLPTDQAT